MNILGWIVLGAIAGYIAGLVVRGDEQARGDRPHRAWRRRGDRRGLLIAAAFFSIGDPIQGALDLRALAVAVIAGVAVVVVVNVITGRRGSDAGPV